jgi:HEAT repeat protein
MLTVFVVSQLRGVITRALHDVEVIVRKSTATVLHEIAELIYDSRCVPWLVLMCERAMTDPEPLLRSAAMTLTWHLADHLPNAFLGDATKGSRYLRRLPSRDDPIFPDVYLLQCKLLPVATRLAEDRAPQVRLAVAAQCDRLCDALGDHWSSVIIDVLVAMLTDADERVRAEAVMCVPRLADVVLTSSPPGVVPAGESSVLDALVPAAIKLQKDASTSVRIALATAAGEMLTLLVALQRSDGSPAETAENSSGRRSIRYEKRHVDERLIPLVQALLHDPDPEVTSSALRAVSNASRGAAREIRPRQYTEDDDSVSIASMTSMTSHTSLEKKDPVFIPVLSEDQVLRLLPTLSELANSKQWRVRQSAVEIVPALLGCTSKFETRAEIARLCIRLTGDRIDAVRRTAAECLCLGGGSLGSHEEDVSGEWITALVIPHIQACSKHEDYRQRLLCLKMVEVVLINGVCPSKWKDEEANADGKNSPLRELLKVTLSLAEDRIANVRLNVGKVLGTVIHVFGEEECRVIKYALLQQVKKERAGDTRQDRDVLYFAEKCLEKCRSKPVASSKKAADGEVTEADSEGS